MANENDNEDACENLDIEGNSLNCSELFNCCDCGCEDGEDGCGCRYCFSCNACESCK